ncbi:G domain-containing protein [Pleurotus pulmonarius]
MDITPCTPFSDLAYDSKSASEVALCIKDHILDIGTPYSLNDSPNFRRSLGILIRLLERVEDAIESGYPSNVQQIFLGTYLKSVHTEVLKILDGILYHRIVLYWTPINPIWCLVYANSDYFRRAAWQIEKLSMDMTRLCIGETMKAVAPTSMLNPKVHKPSPIARWLVPGTPNKSNTSSNPAPKSSLSTRLVSGSQPRSSTNTSGRVQIQDLTKEDKIIVLMGVTGAGKSTFINTLIGPQDGAVVGDGLDPCTQNVQAYRCFHPQTRKRVVFVDTPGFDETRDVEILVKITTWLGDLHKRRLAPSGFLYLHSLSANRVGPIPLKNMLQFTKICGLDAFPNVSIISTMGEAFEESRRDEIIRQVNKYWKPLKPSSSRYFDNTPSVAWSIVDSFSGAPTAPLVAKEMVDGKKSLLDTTVGRFLYDWLQTALLAIERSIAYIKKNFLQLPGDWKEKTKSLNSALDTIFQQIEQLQGLSKKVVKSAFAERRNLAKDSRHTSAHLLLSISSLSTQLKQMINWAPLIAVPHIPEGVKCVNDICQMIVDHKIYNLHVITLLQNLSDLFWVGFDGGVNMDGIWEYLAQ